MRAYPTLYSETPHGTFFAGRSDRARVRAVADAIERVLTARHLEAAAVPGLAARDTFADAARILRAELPGLSADPFAILLDRNGEHLRALRLAAIFRAIKINAPTPRLELFTARDLHRLVKEGNEHAREALACLGSIDWPKATRRERAAFALAELCAAHLERSK